MPKNRPTVMDPINDVILDGKGNVASDFKAKRKELVSDLVDLLQGTVEAKLSGSDFSGKIDLVGNYLFELQAYMTGLKTACSSITDNYPDAENDGVLDDLRALCDVTAEGIRSAEQYLDALKSFAHDVQNIKGQIYTQLQHLHSEV